MTVTAKRRKNSFGLWPALSCVMLSSALSAPGFAKTVIIPAGGPIDKLVIVESRQEVRPGLLRRMLTFVPVSASDAPVSFVIAQNDLTAASQVHMLPSSFVTKLADFSAPRLAVYADPNPCIAGKDAKDSDSAAQPTMSVAGVPFPPERPGAQVSALFFAAKDLKKHARGLNAADQAILTKLGQSGHGLVRVDATVKRQTAARQDGLALGGAVQLAVESRAAEMVEVHGARGFLVEYLLLAPNTVAGVKADGAATASFPTGSELPDDVASVFPRAYNDWVSSAVKSGAVIRRFMGPTARCDVCYGEPPAPDALQAAGVFWTAANAAAPTKTLRGQAASPAATQEPRAVADTWLSRYLIGKAPKKDLTLIIDTAPAGVSARFVEQASAQRAFIGEIFCPAMDGYKQRLKDRREKTVANLNEWNGWNEKDLADAVQAAGLQKRAWYQDHWQK